MKWLRLLTGFVLLASCHLAQSETLDDIHFLIPAGPGGGWDGTARGIGEALLKSGMAENVSFENMSGGGGGRAIARLIETAPNQGQTLLISSTPMVVRSLQKIFPQSFRDLEPIASVIADYSCFAVRKDSRFASFSDVAAAFLQTPREVTVAGGSVRGSTDHFVIAQALKLAGGNPREVVYIPYDGGGKAMAGLLTGETQVLSTGLSEALEMHRVGEIRILAITADQRQADSPDLPTLKEQGFNVSFANWRGFFAAPGYDESRYAEMRNTIRAVLGTPEFEAVRARNGWARLHIEGRSFYQFLEQQELEIGSLMRELGFLR
ncbi:MAG: tripartite tricarboxylate transporter substrate-binding protein [Proteobacteria bacterium]|nr:tripartite tricarboxylate transporter substrate-binding protein [Pseudomonadota bacterium]